MYFISKKVIKFVRRILIFQCLEKRFFGGDSIFKIYNMKPSLLIFQLLLFTTSVWGQIDVNQIDSLVKENNCIISQINNAVLYKTFLYYDGYRIDKNDMVYETSVTLFFNSDGTLKKAQIDYFTVGDEGTSQYFFNQGVVVYSTYFSYSAMNNGYSISRRLDNNGDLIKIDYIRRDDDRKGVIIEHIQKIGGYDSYSPITNGLFFEKIVDVKSFESVLRDLHINYDIQRPENTISVTFIEPQKGDITNLNENNVFVYQKPSFDSRIIDNLNIRPDIIILDAKKDWCKITLGTNNLEGYIHRDHLAPVEKIIE